MRARLISSQERDPKDPRVRFRNHRERGPKRFTYTYSDLARLFGLSESVLYQMTHAGRLDPASLPSVVDAFISRWLTNKFRTESRRARAQLMTVSDFKSLSNDEKLGVLYALAERRSRFDAESANK